MNRFAENAFEGRRVLVTGGAGAIGSNLVRRLAEGGASVLTNTSFGGKLVGRLGLEPGLQCLMFPTEPPKTSKPIR